VARETGGVKRMGEGEGNFLRVREADGVGRVCSLQVAVCREEPDGTHAPLNLGSRVCMRLLR
jgi:hypothetical protein